MRRMICSTILVALGTIALAAAGSAAGTSPIEGRWKTKKATVQELVDFGVPRKDAQRLNSSIKTPALDFHGGVVKGLALETGRVLSTGTYRLRGNLIRFVFRSGSGVRLGVPYDLRWTIYRDRLTFSRLPARPPLIFVINPWTRVS